MKLPDSKLRKFWISQDYNGWYMFQFNNAGLLSFANDRSHHNLSKNIYFYRVVSICFEARDILKPMMGVSKCKIKPLPRLTLSYNQKLYTVGKAIKYPFICHIWLDSVY